MLALPAEPKGHGGHQYGLKAGPRWWPLCRLLAQQDVELQRVHSTTTVEFWGSVDYTSLTDTMNNLSLDGDVMSFSFGVDKQFNEDLVAGVSLVLNNASFELDSASTGDDISGTYTVDITIMSPYVS